jgi:hypothetical protein
MEKEPIRTTREEPLRKERADEVERDPRNPNLMWIFAAALLFLVGVGIYVSTTRDHAGNEVATPASPTSTESSVAGSRSPSYQATGQSGGPGAADTTGRRTTTGEQTTGQ